MKYLRRKEKQTEGGERAGQNEGNQNPSQVPDTSTLPHLVYSPVLRIHKAWRHYKDYKLSTTTTTTEASNTTPSNNNLTTAINSQDISVLNATKTNMTTTTTSLWQSRLDNHRYCTTNNNNNNNPQDITNNNIIYHSTDDVSNFPINNNNNNFKLTHPLIESDPNSISSDHSELNDSFRDQLASLDLTTTTPFLSNKQHNDHFNLIFDTIHKSSSAAADPLSDPDTRKRIRKTNLLNIASEFAALKKVNSHALPFNLHHNLPHNLPYTLQHTLCRDTCSGNASDTDEIMLPYDHHHHHPHHHHHHPHNPLFTNDINNNNDFNNTFENGGEDDIGSGKEEGGERGVRAINKDTTPIDLYSNLVTKETNTKDICDGLKVDGSNDNANSAIKRINKTDAENNSNNNNSNNNNGDDDDVDDDDSREKNVYHACDYDKDVDVDDDVIRGCGDGGCDDDDGDCIVNARVRDKINDNGGDENNDNKSGDDGYVAGNVCCDNNSKDTKDITNGINNNSDVANNNNNNNGGEFSVITITTTTNNNNRPGVNLRKKSSISRSSSNRQLRSSEEEKQKIWQHRLSTREEILKKLAFQGDEDADLPHQSNGLFYLNEAANEIEREKIAGADNGGGGGGYSGDGGYIGGSGGNGDVARDLRTSSGVVFDGIIIRNSNSSIPGAINSTKSTKAIYRKGDVIDEGRVGGVSYLTQTVTMETKVTPDIIASTNDVPSEDFVSRQERLQREAKMALAQARPMAYMQLQLEKKKLTKSPLADIMGMEGLVEGELVRLSLSTLRNMNIAQLQVVVNELHARIEVLNGDLMDQLVNRDDLHTVQDSMLVDIEDLTGRAQEFAARVSKRKEEAANVL